MRNLDFEHGDDLGIAVMSNFDGLVEDGVDTILKDNPGKFGQYSAWDFCGYVWWDKDSEQFICQVWQYKDPTDELSTPTLEGLMAKVSEKYGYK